MDFPFSTPKKIIETSPPHFPAHSAQGTPRTGAASMTFRRPMAATEDSPPISALRRFRAPFRKEQRDFWWVFVEVRVT